MTDFRKIIEDKKRDFDKKVEAEAKKLKEDKNNNEIILADKIKKIENYVYPVLIDIKQSLQANDMDIKVEEVFDVIMYSNPEPKIIFTIGSPARRSDGYRATSGNLIIIPNGDNFHMGLTTSYGKHLSGEVVVCSHSEIREKILPFIEKMVDDALEQYKNIPR